MSEEARPPYVRFEVRAVEDREASIEAGHFVGKDVTFAIVTPTGSKDQVEREAAEWLKNIEAGVQQERIPGFWLTAYTKALEDFNNAQETPEFGTAVKDWPGASPSQVKLLIDINVRTVEELAAANEETINRIGMGGRALKQKAQAWLDSSSGQGKLSEELAQLRVANEELKTRDAEREAEFIKMNARLEALEPKEAKAKEKA